MRDRLSVAYCSVFQQRRRRAAEILGAPGGHWGIRPANLVPSGVPQPVTASYPGPALYPPVWSVVLSPETTSTQPAAPTTVPPLAA